MGEGVVVLRGSGNGDYLDIVDALRLIAERGITRLMVEGGPTLAAHLLAADLVDEAVLFQSKQPAGADGIDALEGLPLTALTRSPLLDCVHSEVLGADSCDIFERK